MELQTIDQLRLDLLNQPQSTFDLSPESNPLIVQVKSSCV